VTQVRIIIQEKTEDSNIADDEVCIVVVLPPHKDFCTPRHRSEFNRKLLVDPAVEPGYVISWRRFLVKT
jgi:hypothetical protein